MGRTGLPEVPDLVLSYDVESTAGGLSVITQD